MVKKDLVGRVFGRLEVLYENGGSKDGRVLWHCRCSCDAHTELDVSSHYLLSGDTRSCGCLKEEILVKRNTTHNFSKTRFYRIWQAMCSRCLNFHFACYSYYGGRGIKVCERWKKFENFKEDMYESYIDHVEKFGEKDTTIDRIDVDGDYELNNCRWATCKEQAQNIRCIKVAYNGEEHSVREWADILGISMGKIFDRLQKKLPIEDVLYAGNLRKKKYDITYNGETHTLDEWAKITGVSKVNIRNRFNKGLSLDRVFFNGDLRTLEEMK